MFWVIRILQLLIWRLLIRLGLVWRWISPCFTMRFLILPTRLVTWPNRFCNKIKYKLLSWVCLWKSFFCLFDRCVFLLVICWYLIFVVGLRVGFWRSHSWAWHSGRRVVQRQHSHYAVAQGQSYPLDLRYAGYLLPFTSLSTLTFKSHLKLFFFSIIKLNRACLIYPWSDASQYIHQIT